MRLFINYCHFGARPKLVIQHIIELASDFNIHTEITHAVSCSEIILMTDIFADLRMRGLLI